MNLLEIPLGTKFTMVADSEYPTVAEGTVVLRRSPFLLDDADSVVFTIESGSITDIDDINYGVGDDVYLDANNLGAEVK